MAGALLSPPHWDDKQKEFSLWLREVKAWKAATENVTGLKEVHGLQLALHLPDGSEIRKQLFDTLDTDEMKGDAGWNKIIDLLERHYKKDDNTTAFETWREFRNFSRRPDQNIDDYIMLYEKYKTRMNRYNMKLGEHIHGLNLLCGANLTDSELRIAIREVNNDTPDEMYNDAKKSLKKYFGNSAITNLPTNNLPFQVKQEQPFFSSVNDYDSYVAWKRSGKFKARNDYKPDIRNTLSSKNPIGPDGKPMRCHNCDSIAHFARNCPHRKHGEKKNVSDNGSNPERSWIASTNDYIECQVADVKHDLSFQYMILDTGCPQNVSGLSWANCYLDSLSDDMFKCVKKLSSTNNFKFGGGRVLKSVYKLEVPILIGGIFTTVQFDVVDNDLPLLLGKQTMKEWNLVISTSTETAEIAIQNKTVQIELYTSISKHWCIYIHPGFPVETMNVLFSVADMTKREKLLAAKRIHRQYCHPSYEFLRKVLGVFDTQDDEFMQCLKSYSENCNICKRYKRSIPKPAVGNLIDPSKMKFNEIVSIDLKQRNNKWIIYMIDTVTRYTRADFIKSKDKNVVINKIIELWISVFGAANVFLMDNGGEFANDAMRELGNQFGITIKHTAAYSPWANGINERNHATVDLMMAKMLEDMPAISETVALQYSIAIRNCSMFINGYTPAQLALGQNPKLPSNFSNHLPALEGFTTSPLIAQHLNAIAVARKAFIQAETDKKLSTALKHPVRQYSDTIFHTNDKVFYKLPTDRRWQGPAFVIGVDGKVIFIRHGSVVRRVHPCHLQHVGSEEMIFNDDGSDDCKDDGKRDVAVAEEDGAVDAVDELDGSAVDGLAFNEHADYVHECGDGVVGGVDLDDGCLQVLDGDGDVARGVDAEHFSTENTDVVMRKQVADKLDVPKRNQVVEFRCEDDSCWKQVKMLGSAGKKTGLYKNWVNVEDAEKSFSMDWSQVSEWRVLDDVEVIDVDKEGCDGTEVCVAVVKEVSDEFQNCKEEELKKWMDFNVYEEVEDVGQDRLSGRWVCTRKMIDGEIIRKARFVIRGFQEHSNITSDSPTGSKDCLRTILAVISAKQWSINTIDIKSAFLQGNPLERNIFIVPPKEANTNNLWKLNKCIYGLNDAARKWYFSVNDTLSSLGCIRSKIDYCLFYYFNQSQLCGIILTHVDDFLCAGEQSFYQHIIQPFCNKYQVGHFATKVFEYVGIKIEQADNAILLDQIDYINNITSIPVTREHQQDKGAQCNDKYTLSYRKLVGKLNWVATQSRPEYLFAIGQLSQKMKSPIISDIIQANKILNQLQTKPLRIMFPTISDIANASVICYSDASLGKLPSGHSTGGFIIFLKGPNNMLCPLTWSSKILRRVVRSTVAAETSSMIDCLDAACFLKAIFKEMLLQNNGDSFLFDIVAYTDNEALFRNAYAMTMADERRLRIDIAAIKEMLSKNELRELRWVPSNHQLADALTKHTVNPLKLALVLENGSLL